MKHFITLMSLSLAMTACQGEIDVPEMEPPVDPPGVTLTPPVLDPSGQADFPTARRVRRLTAEQFHRSLTVATGHSWDKFDRFAGSMGRPDLAEVTEESRDLSVTFDKLAGDAARDTCALAVAADRGVISGEATGERVILNHVDETVTSGPAVLENLKYLVLRFHGVAVTSDDDPRLAPWTAVLAHRSVDEETGMEIEPDADAMALRWRAVCVGLATHPDFVTY